MAKKFSWLGNEYFDETPVGASSDNVVPAATYPEVLLEITPTSVDETLLANKANLDKVNNIRSIESSISELEDLTTFATESLQHGGLSPIAAELYTNALTRVAKRYDFTLPVFSHGLESFIGYSDRKVATEGLISGTKSVIKMLARMVLAGWRKIAKESKLQYFKFKAGLSGKIADIGTLKGTLRERVIESSLPALKTTESLSHLCVENEFDLDACIRFATETKSLDDSAVVWRGIMTNFSNDIYRNDQLSSLTDLMEPISTDAKKSIHGSFATSMFHTVPIKGYALPGNVVIGITKIPGSDDVTIKYSACGKSGWPKSIPGADSVDVLLASLNAAEVLAQRIAVKLDNFTLTSDVISKASKQLEAIELDVDRTESDIEAAKNNIESAWNIEAGICYAMVSTLDGLIAYVKSNMSYM